MNSKNKNLKNEANSILGSDHGRSKKKKIAIFHCGFIYSGGGERIVLEEARGLKMRGYNVDVWAPTMDSKRCFPDFINEIGAKTFLPSFFDWLPFRTGLRMVVSSILAPLLAVNFRDVDIFVGANQPGAWMAFCMAKVLGKPYIVYLNQPNRVVFPRPVDVKYGWHSTERDYQILFKLFQFVKPLLAFLDKQSIVRADRVLANGGYIGDVIENIYSTRTIDAPAGSYHYPLAKLRLNSHTIYSGRIKIKGSYISKPYALITNRHDPQKRFDFVIKAMKHIAADYKKAKLIIPGPFTKHTHFLIRKAKELGVEDSVLFLGKVSEEDLQKLYRHATVYCYPSPQEDFGLGPLEAGGWGVPTVAWNHGGPTVTVEDGVTGYLAKPYKTTDYADKMLKLFQDQELRARMGRAAWERTRTKFSWDKHSEVLEKTITQFI